MCAEKVPLDVIQNVLKIQESFCPRYNIDWDNILDKLANLGIASGDTFSFLVQSSIAKRVNAIGVKQWRTNITNKIDKIQTHTSIGPDFLAKARAELVLYEAEFHKLKEATTVLELALCIQG